MHGDLWVGKRRRNPLRAHTEEARTFGAQRGLPALPEGAVQVVANRPGQSEHVNKPGRGVYSTPPECQSPCAEVFCRFYSLSLY
jgi:hypothetical protein